MGTAGGDPMQGWCQPLRPDPVPPRRLPAPLPKGFCANTALCRHVPKLGLVTHFHPMGYVLFCIPG